MQKEIPILFSTPMVLAILAGRKTETRRLAKPRSNLSILNDDWDDSYVLDDGNKEWLHMDNRYGQPGDLLWVRETWAPKVIHEEPPGDIVHYFAADSFAADKWKPSIHMPRAASRIWLLNEGVHLERLQKINDDGAIAEGVKPLLMKAGHVLENAKTVYSQLWDLINEKNKWETNPWVWVIKFKVLSTTGRPNSLRDTA